MKTSEQIIEKLKALKEDNYISSYVHIKNILKNQLIPLFAISEFKPYRLTRCRKHNIGENFFESSRDLSYKNEILHINKFGRANEPGQGLFYCNDHKNRSTGITETVSVFRGNKESKEEILTMGVWNVNKILNLAVILPSNYNLGLNPEFDKIKEDFNKFCASEDFEEVKLLIEFIANEFTLDLEKHKSNYKITCAYANYIKELFPKIDGIIYGSVKSEFNGTNIVLWPEVVDKKIEFFKAIKSSFKRVDDTNFVEIETFESKNYDRKNDKIIW